MLDGDVQVCYTGGPAPPWLDQNAWYIPVQVPKESVDKMPVSTISFASLVCDLLRKSYNSTSNPFSLSVTFQGGAKGSVTYVYKMYFLV